MGNGDLGESLVGAYLRHIERCSVVVYNNFFPDQQGEVDVVGIRGIRPREVFLCEVTTHIDGMDTKMIERIDGKLARLREFAELTYPGEQYHYQWWSPNVPTGKRANAFELVRTQWAEEGRSLELIFNQAYTSRVAALIDYARRHSSTTSEPAYRLLQVLTHMRGARPSL
jgi:hypothetical protein